MTYEHIQSAIEAVENARRLLAVDGSFRTRVLIDMLLLELDRQRAAERAEREVEPHE